MPFTDKDRLAAATDCRYCPMCHHANVETSVLRRETYSARGRGLLIFAQSKGKATWDEAMADVMYKFAADGLARHVCAGHIRHDEMVIDARQQLIKAGTAPAVVKEVRQNIEKVGNPWGGKEPDLAALTGTSSKGDTLVYFGPWARIKRPGSVKALAAVLKKAGVSYSFLPEEGDPGLLSYQLGDVEEGYAAARVLEGKISKAGAGTVVVLDAAAWRVLSAGFGEHPAIKGPKVRHVSQYLAELKLKLKAKGGKVAYHDPCALARFAPCTDSPRALLKVALDGAPLEIGPWSADKANCSGECGGVPFTNPGLAAGLAARRIGEAKAAGAELVVAGDPASAASLDGHGLPVRDLAEFAADCLG